MKIFNVLITILLLSPTLVIADTERKSETIVDSTNASAMAVASTATIFSKSFSLLNQNPSQSVGVMYKATSSGVVGLKLEAEQSYGRPTTEGSSDPIYIAWKTLDSNVTDQNWHMATLDTVVVPYGRFKITGIGSNDTSTTIQIKLGKD